MSSNLSAFYRPKTSAYPHFTGAYHHHHHHHHPRISSRRKFWTKLQIRCVSRITRQLPLAATRKHQTTTKTSLSMK